MAFGQLVRGSPRALRDQRMKEATRAVEFVQDGHAIRVVGNGWAVQRTDACTISIVLDDYAGEEQTGL